MEPNKKETIHRVGTITCGTVLIVTGILFLLHIIFPVISYLFIFRLWPCILILLGAEILIGNCKKDVSFVYDTGSVVLLILLLLFAMAMAVVDYWIHNPYAASLYLY
ncbi:MAG: hypothetical protein HFJ05_05820 [Eubacterium sp.]|nr:hypothetical protein [Eubacterium sp.]